MREVLYFRDNSTAVNVQHENNVLNPEVKAFCCDYCWPLPSPYLTFNFSLPAVCFLFFILNCPPSLPLRPVILQAAQRWDPLLPIMMMLHTLALPRGQCTSLYFPLFFGRGGGGGGGGARINFCLIKGFRLLCPRPSSISCYEKQLLPQMLNGWHCDHGRFVGTHTRSRAFFQAYVIVLFCYCVIDIWSEWLALIGSSMNSKWRKRMRSIYSFVEPVKTS